MTKPGAQNTPSNFNARADSAAQALRGNLQRQGREVPDSAPVVVDASGNPPPPPPPKGSYAAQALEIEMRKQKQRAMQPEQRAEDLLAEGDEPGAEAAPQAAAANSPRAEQRIQELVNQLRQKDQDLQEALAMGKTATETAGQFQTRLQALEQQHHQMLQANLENLDPETRARVLADAHLNQRMAELEQRLLGKIAPALDTLQRNAAQHELQAIADRYPGFNYQLHAPLIDRFRAKNPHCSIEQAFRAVAEPEELAPRRQTRATAIPPTIPPGNGAAGSPRFAPPAQPQHSNPDQELIDESKRIAELRRSTDPAKQKEGLQALDAHLRRRLGG